MTHRYSNGMTLAQVKALIKRQRQTKDPMELIDISDQIGELIEFRNQAMAHDEPGLCPTACEILLWMEQVGASPDCAVTSAEIRDALNGASIRYAMRNQLIPYGYVETATGRNGRCWLTQLGLIRAIKLKD